MVHYWAAFDYFMRAEGSWECSLPNKYPNQHFFCRERHEKGKPNGFRGFLMMADAFLNWATTFVPASHTNKKPILSMEECFYVPHPYYEIKK